MENQPIVIPQNQGSKYSVKKIGIAVGIVMVIFTIFAVFLTANDYAKDVSKLSADQSELARVLEIGIDHDSASQATKNLAATVRSIALSSVNVLVAIEGGDKVPKEVASEAADNTSEQALENSAKINLFNDTFIEIITDKVDDIHGQLALLSNKVSANEKTIIDSLTADFSLILDELST